MPSPFQTHVNNWRNCDKCELHQYRQNVVLCRGKLPCDILFVGEAPGISENALGQPFIGEAGRRVLDPIVEEVNYNLDLRLAFTNLVGCIPLNEDHEKIGEPLPEHIKSCHPRLEEFVLIAQPKLIVCVGTLAEKWLMPTGPTNKRHLLRDYNHSHGFLKITHPAAIIRMNVAQAGLEIQRCKVVLRNAFMKLKGE
jgi:uracil-DNA glycosylase family 4